MRKLTFIIAVVAAVAAMPVAALANVSYNYIGAGYGALKPDGISRLDGYTVDGSVAVHQHVHLFANYLRAKDSPLTAQRVRGGAGLHFPMNSQWDIVARGGWSYVKLSHSTFGSNDDDGAFAQIGFRGMAAEALEVNAFLSYDDTESKASADIGAIFYFTPRFGATASYTYSSNVQTWGVGLRYTFY